MSAIVHDLLLPSINAAICEQVYQKSIFIFTEAKRAFAYNIKMTPTMKHDSVIIKYTPVKAAYALRSHVRCYIWYLVQIQVIVLEPQQKQISSDIISNTSFIHASR